MACLAQDQCQAASFHQSTSTCQLFSNIPNEGGGLTANVGTKTMFVIFETRMPPDTCDNRTCFENEIIQMYISHLY